MRFILIDQIVRLQPGVSITAVKSLARAEEYLGEHFPGFPVMPGVLILEAMVQAGAWLIRTGEDFAHSMIVLDRAEHVRYGHFLEPGSTLTITAEVFGQDAQETQMKASGRVNGRTTVCARLVLRRYNLADADSGQAEADRMIVEQLRTQFAMLCRPGTLVEDC